MRLATSLVGLGTLLSVFALGANPVQGIGVTTCEPGGNVLHVYVLSAGAYVSVNDEATGRAPVLVADGCAFDDIQLTVGDGDPDFGVGGGAFPSYSTCLNRATVIGVARAIGHHSPSGIHVRDNLGLGIATTAGTDGPALAVVPPYYKGDWTDCVGNGIISNDATTDPADCGSGLASHGTADAYPTIAPNTAGEVCSRPADGMFWVALGIGPYWDTVSGNPPTVDDPVDDCDLRDPDHTPPVCIGHYLVKFPNYANPDDFIPLTSTLGVSVPTIGTITTN